MQTRQSVWIVLVMGTVAMTFKPSTSSAAEDPFRPPAVTTTGASNVPPELMERLRQYQNVRAAGFRGWSLDGKGILIATRFGDTAQLHRVYEPGGRREQLTFFHEPADGRFLPNATDGAILLVLSAGGNENYQVHLLDRKTGQSPLLTDGKSRNLLGPVLQDGSKMIVSNNSRNGRDTDIYIGDPRKPGSLKMLMEVDNEHWSAQDWSRDGTTLLLNKYVSINESYPALFDVATGKKTMIPIPGGVTASYGDLDFAPDAKTVYVTTDAKSEFRQLARVDLKTFEYTWLTDDIHWDVSAVEVDQKTGRVAFTVNENGAGVLYLLDGDKRKKVDLPLGTVSSLDFSPDGSQLGFSLSRPDAPADAYSIVVETGKLTRWTYSEVGGLNPETFIKPEGIKFASFDGREVPAYCFKPRSASKQKPAPVVIQIHGGPESQYHPDFSGIDQFYLNELGTAVIAPNVRGSSGYGKTYLKLDNAEKREDSVRDIGALLDWIKTQPDLDASRVTVVGGSYGGYMVLASLVHFGDRIKAGVDIVGIASFNSFLKNTSAYRRDLRRAEYGDERDPKMQEFFERIDPLNNAEKIKSALLVAHGKNDPRVPFSEAEQIVAKVRGMGRDVWTFYADNEGHGFAKKANRDYLTAVTVMFLREHMK